MTLGYLNGKKELLPLEPHTANSKWQFCNCQSCQEKRMLIEAAPGKPIDFSTYRRKDEKY